jgi:hypothetical protein
MAKKKRVLGEGKCLKDAILILAKAGLPPPGTSEGEVSYVVKLNRKGAVEGVDVHLSDAFMGMTLERFTRR